MKAPDISLNRDELSKFENAIQKEWIIANGLGGYASSSVLGINTRKYHGLLVAAFNPPGDRRVCLEKLDEEICIGNSTYPLGANEFEGRIFPQGHLWLNEFSFSPIPKFFYSTQAVEVEKAIVVPHERNAVVVLYKVFNRNTTKVNVSVLPLINWRHFHSVTDRWKTQGKVLQKAKEDAVCICPNQLDYALALKSIGGKYFAEDKWLEDVYYREEVKRGESYLDDCYQTGRFKFDVGASCIESFAVIATADKEEETAREILDEMPRASYDLGSLFDKQLARREDVLTKFYGSHTGVQTVDWLSLLLLTADSFVVRRSADQRSLIAGYHWFECWGRDTFVSLPGLLLATGRFKDARNIFVEFSARCRNGLIPNFVHDSSGRPSYNSADATLWFVNAVLQYVKYSGDFEFVYSQLWRALKEMVDYHFRGTLFGIHVDDDGLLVHGERLTWMDAAVDGVGVTPRAGKAVEIQALWFNGLKTMEVLAERFNEKTEAERFGATAEKVKRSFARRFWSAERNYLYDVIDQGKVDASLRPNQIIAVSLDFSMLDEEKNERVVDVVQNELLTPFGLRTLSWKDPMYVGVYAGDRRSRDRAYHNGSVWPWLLGPFTTAFLKTKGSSDFRRDYALRTFLWPLLKSRSHGVEFGTIFEIFDGDAPHTPRGCISQAWSVAEFIRAYMEDIMHIEPKYEKDVLAL